MQGGEGERRKRRLEISQGSVPETGPTTQARPHPPPLGPFIFNLSPQGPRLKMNLEGLGLSPRTWI